MLPLLPIAVVGSYMKQRQADEMQRKQAAVDIMKQQAASLGAPGYGMEAAQVNHNIEMAPTATDKLLQGYAGSKLKGAMAKPDAQDEDLLKGL